MAQPSTCVAPAADGRPSVWCSTFAARPDMREAYIRTFAAAFEADRAHELLRLKPGRRAEFWAGFAQMSATRWAALPVLFHTEDGRCLAVLCSASEYKLLDAFALPCLPAYLRMLRGLPLPWFGHCFDCMARMADAGADALRDAGVGEVAKLAVIVTHPAHQRQGLGSALLLALCDRADAERSPIFLEVVNDELLPWYRRCVDSTGRACHSPAR